jgi:hypothetical protein
VSDVSRTPSQPNEHLVLIFAYHYPPANTIGGVRPFQFSKYLIRLGYKCRVFTASNQGDRDDPITEYVPDPFLASRDRSGGYLLERALRKGFFPGSSGTGWSYRVRKAALACMAMNPDLRITVLSTFPPIGTHFAALRLIRSNRLRWIADFRDPLPCDGKHKSINRFHRKSYGWLEYFIARTADAVVVNTDAALHRLQLKFPAVRDRLHLIWNGFDPEDRIQPLPVPVRPYKLLSHVGELYFGRNATPILESVVRLIENRRFRADSVRVQLVGSIESDCIPGPEFVRRAIAAGWLDIVPEEVPKQTARQIMQTSDALLLLQPQSSVQVPGKLFQYLQIGRPILAFVQRDSPIEWILGESGVPYRCVYTGSSSEAIDDTLEDFFNLPSTPVIPSSAFEEKFNAKHQTYALDTLIRLLHAGPKSIR